eukprot:75030_1
MILYKDLNCFYVNQFNTYIKHYGFYQALRIPHVIDHEIYNDQLMGLYKDKAQYLNKNSDKQPPNSEIIRESDESITRIYVKFKYTIHPLLSYDTPGHLKWAQNNSFVQCVGSGGDCLEAGSSQCFDAVSWVNIGFMSDGSLPYQEFVKQWTKNYDKEFSINILVAKHLNQCVYWRHTLHCIWRLDLSALLKGLNVRVESDFETIYVETGKGDPDGMPYKCFDGDRIIFTCNVTARKLLQTPEFTRNELQKMKKPPSKYTRKFIIAHVLHIWSLQTQELAQSKLKWPKKPDEWHNKKLDDHMKVLGIPFKRPGPPALLNHALCNLHIDCGCAKLNVNKPLGKLLEIQTTLTSQNKVKKV